MIQRRFAEVQRDHEAHMKQLFSNMQFLTKNGQIDDGFDIDNILKQMDSNYNSNIIIDQPIKNDNQQIVNNNAMKNNNQDKKYDAVNTNKKGVMTPPEVQKPELKRQNAIPPSRDDNYSQSSSPAHKVTYHVFGEVKVANTTLNVTQNSSAAESVDMVQVPMKSKQQQQQQQQQKDNDEELLIVDHDNEDHLSDDQIDKMLNSTADNNEDASEHKTSEARPNKINNQSNVIIDQEIKNNNNQKKNQKSLSYTFQFISQPGENLESNLRKMG
eukprot:UN02003